MASKSPIYCPVCNEAVRSGETLEHHLFREHEHRELAEFLASEWEAKELSDEL